MKSLSTAISLIITLGLAGCGSSGTTLTVTGKEYIYPKFQPEWLSPCSQPESPVKGGKFPTNEDLMRYVIALIESLDKCNLKITSINKSYGQFTASLDATIKDMKDTNGPSKESETNP